MEYPFKTEEAEEDAPVTSETSYYDAIIPIAPNREMLVNIGKNSTGESIFAGYTRCPDGTAGPAEQCQLIREKGDVVVAVNGLSTAGKSHWQVIDMLRTSCNTSRYAMIRFRKGQREPGDFENERKESAAIGAEDNDDPLPYTTFFVNDQKRYLEQRLGELDRKQSLGVLDAQNEKLEKRVAFLQQELENKAEHIATLESSLGQPLRLKKLVNSTRSAAEQQQHAFAESRVQLEKRRLSETQQELEWKNRRVESLEVTVASLQKQLEAERGQARQILKTEKRQLQQELESKQQRVIQSLSDELERERQTHHTQDIPDMARVQKEWREKEAKLRAQVAQLQEQMVKQVEVAEAELSETVAHQEKLAQRELEKSQEELWGLRMLVANQERQLSLHKETLSKLRNENQKDGEQALFVELLQVELEQKDARLKKLEAAVAKQALDAEKKERHSSSEQQEQQDLMVELLQEEIEQKDEQVRELEATVARLKKNQGRDGASEPKRRKEGVKSGDPVVESDMLQLLAEHQRTRTTEDQWAELDRLEQLQKYRLLVTSQHPGSQAPLRDVVVPSAARLVSADGDTAASPPPSKTSGGEDPSSLLTTAVMALQSLHDRPAETVGTDQKPAGSGARASSSNSILSLLSDAAMAVEQQPADGDKEGQKAPKKTARTVRSKRESRRTEGSNSKSKNGNPKQKQAAKASAEPVVATTADEGTETTGLPEAVEAEHSDSATDSSLPDSKAVASSVENPTTEAKRTSARKSKRKRSASPPAAVKVAPSKPKKNDKYPTLSGAGRTLDQLRKEFESRHPTEKRPQIQPNDVASGKGEKMKQQNTGYRELIRAHAPLFRGTNTGNVRQDLYEKRTLAYRLALTVVDRGGCFLSSNAEEPLDAKKAFKRVMTSLKDWRPSPNMPNMGAVEAADEQTSSGTKSSPYRKSAQTQATGTSSLAVKKPNLAPARMTSEAQIQEMAVASPEEQGVLTSASAPIRRSARCTKGAPKPQHNGLQPEFAEARPGTTLVQIPSRTLDLMLASSSTQEELTEGLNAQILRMAPAVAMHEDLPRTGEASSWYLSGSGAEIGSAPKKRKTSNGVATERDVSTLSIALNGRKGRRHEEETQASPVILHAGTGGNKVTQPSRMRASAETVGEDIDVRADALYEDAALRGAGRESAFSAFSSTQGTMIAGHSANLGSRSALSRSNQAGILEDGKPKLARVVTQLKTSRHPSSVLSRDGNAKTSGAVIIGDKKPSVSPKRQAETESAREQAVVGV